MRCRRVCRQHRNAGCPLDDFRRCGIARVHFDRPYAVAVQDEVDAEQTAQREASGQDVANSANFVA